MNSFYQEQAASLGLQLGLLTHRKSRYSKQPSIQLFEEVSSTGKLIGVDVSIFISEDDLFSPKDVGWIDLLLVKFFELRLNKEWASYIVNKKIRKLRRNDIKVLLACLSYYRSLLQPSFRFKEKVRYSRILNITAGHQSLLQDFLNTRKSCCLILEDDAGFTPSLGGEMVAAIFELYEFAQTVKSEAFFMDLSDSFTFRELGVENLVIRPESPGRVFLGSELLTTTKPFTNCTCAVLFSRPMAEKFCSALKRDSRIHGKRLIPIDWSLNLLLLENANANPRIESFHLEPGLFLQQSLTATKAR